MGSTAESEIGASYINGKEEIPIRTALEEMGHPQPPTLMRVYNTTAVGFANGKKNAPKQMICDFIGSKTEQNKANLSSTGDLETKSRGLPH